MKNNRTKVLTRIIALVLCAVMLTLFSISTFAEENTSRKQYVKDVKLIYAETEAEAKTLVPEGYTLLDKDLNEGSDTDNKVYIAYSVTTNPDEAITDIKMMNMKGGFVLSDYEDQMKDVNENVKKLANDVKISVERFSENYFKGTYGAKAAYRALSVFTVEEAESNLADYLIYGKPIDEFYIKFVLNAHQDVLSAVISALTMAVQGEAGNTWLDRLAAIEDPADIYEQPTYWDDSVILWEHFNGFYEVYKTIDHSLYEIAPPSAPTQTPTPGEGDNNEENAPPTVPEVDPETQPAIENNGTEALYEVAYRVLKGYKFKSGETFDEWFLGESVMELEIFENFFCMLEVMTPEELAMMRLCGPLYMILSTGMDEVAYNDYVERIDEITKDGATCSIWEGVNSELFRSSIGITDDAARKIAETEFERELNNEGDSLGMAGLKTAGLIAACGAVSLGLGIATYFAFGSAIYACFGGTAISAATAALSVGATIFMSVSLALGIAAIGVALVVAIVFLIVWIIEIHKEKHPEYTDIPEFMYDYVEDGSGNNQFILYEGVRFQDGRVADVNVWEGKEWHAMYVSHDKAAGAPIEADFTVRYGDGKIDKDYAGLSNFGHINAQNLNAFDFDDEVGGVFVTYRQEDLTGDYARKDYLSDVKLFSGENADAVALKLKNQKYTLYEQNLTPDSDYVTYLGYKTTNNESRALTDIRLTYGYNSKQYTTGANKASYAASGSTGDGMLTLYATTISLFGTPIRSDFLILNDRKAPAGYEPVNFFDGGPAVNLNLRDEAYIDSEKKFYLFFLPSVTYTSGTQYIGGLATVFDVSSEKNSNYIFSLYGADNLLDYQRLFASMESGHPEGALLYTTTYNPYRAIYGVTAASSGDEMGSLFAQTMFYDGVGYSLSTRYLIEKQGKVRFDDEEERDNDSRIYVAGVYPGGSPMTVSQLCASNDRDGAPEGMTPVSARLSDNARAVNVGGGFDLTPFYLFVGGRHYKEGNYITDIYLASKEEILNSSGEINIDCDDLDNSYVMNQLAALGAHTAVLKNLNLADSDNATYLAYTKRVKTAGVNPITDIILYYAGKTDAKPKDNIVLGGITYKLAGNANIFCEEGDTDAVCERVYLYYTTNPAAGSPIIDIKIDNTAILNGWETARTQNKKALYDDMDDYASNMWFLHMKRIVKEPKYISEVVIGVGGSDAEAKAVLIAAGCEYMLEKDLNNNVGAHSDYIYLGYKRTSDPNKAIRDFRTTHDDEVESFVKNGATYHRIDGNLNSYTNVFADDIYLYYTMNAKAGTPITSLGTSASVANWSHGEGNRYVVKTVLNQHGEASDLNDGADGDYIYLLQTRDKQDERGAVASMIGGGSLMIVVGLFMVSVAVIAWICVSKKKQNVTAGAVADEANETENGESV